MNNCCTLIAVSDMDRSKQFYHDLLGLEVADRIIPEPEGGAHTNPAALFRTLDTALVKELNALGKLSGPALAAGRYKKFRAMGAKALRKERT